MNSLSWLLYLADVASSLSILGTIALFALIVLAIAMGIIGMVMRDSYETTNPKGE